ARHRACVLRRLGAIQQRARLVENAVAPSIRRDLPYTSSLPRLDELIGQPPPLGFGARARRATAEAAFFPILNCIVPAKGSVVSYLGQNLQSFREAFKEFGVVKV